MFYDNARKKNSLTGVILCNFQKYLTIFIDNERYSLHVSAHFIGIFLKSSIFGVCKFYIFISTFGLFFLQFLTFLLRKYLLQRSFKNDLIEASFSRKFLKIKTLEIVSDLQGLKGSTHKGRSSAAATEGFARIPYRVRT